MLRKWKKYRKKIYTIAVIVVAVFTLIIEIGSRIPNSGIPTFEKMFADLGISSSSSTVDGTLEVHAIDVGNADCLLIRQGEHAMLIDAGERGDADTILDYLRHHSVQKLDLAVATHAHADHIGSMARIIRDVPIDRFLMAYMPEKSTPTSSTYISMLEALDAKNIPVDEAAPDTAYRLGDAQIEVLAPLEETTDCNNMSVVLYLTFGQNHFLLMGDAEKPVEKLLMATGKPLQADVLKVGHHGSDTASTPAFLKQVMPTYAVVTCGIGNTYGHPHQKALDNLRNNGITVYRSDVNGSVVFTSDGKTVTAHSEK